MFRESHKRSFYWGFACYVFVLLSACVFGGSKDGEATDELSKDSKRGTNKYLTHDSDTALKLAKLWARVDEIEGRQDRIKEKVRVIEKGFTWGLIPEELKSDTAAFPREKISVQKNLDIDVHPVSKSEEKSSSKLDENSASKQEDSETKERYLDGESNNEEYQKAIASAHDQFRAGRYGRSIVEFTEVGKRFGEEIDRGSHKFWIAKSWAALKEFNTARQSFINFIDQSAKSPWIPRAKLELSRVEWRLGLRDTAVKRLKEIIEKYPFEDAAEMAKMELDQLEKSI